MVQKENEKRIRRITEHKRRRIWEAHSSIRQRNDVQKNSSMARQCIIRAQTVLERQSREHASEYLDKLMRVDPYRTEQRTMLTQALVSLNRHMDLGLELTEGGSASARRDRMSPEN